MKAEDMRADEMKLLVALGEERVGAREIHKGVSSRKLLVAYGADKPAEVVTIDLDPPSRKHTITTLESFLEFLASEHAQTDVGAVFVSKQAVVADMGYRKNGEHKVTMPLEYAEEFKALLKLAGSAWTQKPLWRLLATDLDGCIDKGLMLSIGQIKINSKNESDIKIDNSGITTGGGSSNVTVTYRDPQGKGEHTNVLPEWVIWTGRVFECFDRTYTVELRLELDVEEGALVLLFHPKRLETVLRNVRLDLVKRLQEDVAKPYTVHEGSF